MSPPPIVVAGATGSIGRALTARLRAEGRHGIGVSRTTAARHDIRLDLTTPPSSWPAWPAADVTYICIGAGGLDACELDPVGTRRVHVDAVAAVAHHASAAGSRVVFLSSSHVSGETVYGRQKAEAELAVLSRPGAAVLRCSKIVGSGDARLTAWRTALLAGRSIEAFDDLHVAPLWIGDAVTALIDVGDAGEPGIFQLTGRETTYFAMAVALAGHLGVDASLVVPASAQTAGVPPSFRPRGVVLEQVLPRPIDVAPLDVVVARATSFTP